MRDPPVRGPSGAGVDRDLARWQRENQPALARVHPLEPQHVAQEGPGSLGVLGEDDRVRPGDHGADRSAAIAATEQAEAERQRPIRRLGRDRHAPNEAATWRPRR